MPPRHDTGGTSLHFDAEPCMVALHWSDQSLFSKPDEYKPPQNSHRLMIGAYSAPIEPGSSLSHA